MSTRSPDEFDAFLEGITDLERRAAVKAWLSSNIKACAGGCGRPVRVMDGHVTTKTGLKGFTV